MNTMKEKLANVQEIDEQNMWSGRGERQGR